jgi:hypothetical protein
MAIMASLLFATADCSGPKSKRITKRPAHQGMKLLRGLGRSLSILRGEGRGRFRNWQCSLPKMRFAPSARTPDPAEESGRPQGAAKGPLPPQCGKSRPGATTHVILTIIRSSKNELRRAGRTACRPGAGVATARYTIQKYMLPYFRACGNRLIAPFSRSARNSWPGPPRLAPLAAAVGTAKTCWRTGTAELFRNSRGEP